MAVFGRENLPPDPEVVALRANVRALAQRVTALEAELEDERSAGWRRRASGLWVPGRPARDPIVGWDDADAPPVEFVLREDHPVDVIRRFVVASVG